MFVCGCLVFMMDLVSTKVDDCLVEQCTYMYHYFTSYCHSIMRNPCSLLLTTVPMPTHTHTHIHVTIVDRLHPSERDVSCQIIPRPITVPPLLPNLHRTLRTHWNVEWARPVGVPLNAELHPLLPLVRVRRT